MKAFGGGCIPELNDPLGLSQVPECLPKTQVGPNTFVPTAFIQTGINANGSLDVTGLRKGAHKFQCLIHPWMKVGVEVR